MKGKEKDKPRRAARRRHDTSPSSGGRADVSPIHGGWVTGCTHGRRAEYRPPKAFEVRLPWKEVTRGTGGTGTGNGAPRGERAHMRARAMVATRGPTPTEPHARGARRGDKGLCGRHVGAGMRVATGDRTSACPHPHCISSSLSIPLMLDMHQSMHVLCIAVCMYTLGSARSW